MSIARNTLLSPIEPAKATDQVIGRISEAISTGIFMPGDQLPVEAELAEQLNVAQMTLRQALAILRDLGIIETVRGRNGGSFVTNRPIEVGGVFVGKIPTMQELQDMTDYRIAIENEATALAALRADRLTLGQIQLRLDACLSSPGDVDHVIADNSFHVAIAEATNSPRMVRAVSQIQHDMIEFFRRLSRPYEMIHPHKEEHRDIVRAIESGDPDLAWEASNNHQKSNHEFLAGLIQQVSK